MTLIPLHYPTLGIKEVGEWVILATISFMLLLLLIFYFEKIRVFKAGVTQP